MDIYQHLFAAFSRELTEEEMAELQEGKKQYPYFVLPHVLLARATEDEATIFDAALYAPNRHTLRDFMQGKLYFAEIQRQNQMEESQDRRTYSALFPPHPYDAFSILPDLGKPHSLGKEHVQTPLSLSDGSNRLYQDPAFLSMIVSVKTCKYLGLVGKIQQSMRAHKDQAELRYKKTVGADGLVHQFLEKLPKITALHDSKYEVERAARVAEASIEQDEEIVSETLAKIHVQQKNFEEAVRIFQILSLRFPEKKAYFKAEIEKIQKN
ncbi:MAG: hypothetical protein AAF135_00560 [Bacteroidota bacterium]